MEQIRVALARIVEYVRNHQTLAAMALASIACAILNVPHIAALIPVWTMKGQIVGYTFGKFGLAMAVAAAPAKQKLPFRYGTVKRRIPLGTFPITMGAAIPTITLPQVGMLSRILVDIEGTYTPSAGTSTLQLFDGYDAIISRARVGLNNGSANIIDLSGVGINTINRNLSGGFLPIKRGLLVTAAAQTFSYKFILEINANQRRQFEMGLINLQAPELRCTLDLVFNSIAAIFSTPANITLFVATAAVSYEYFEIPDLSRYALPPLTLVRTIEEAPQNIAAVGDQTYQIPRLGTMFNYFIALVQANLYVPVLSNITEWKLKYNKSDVQYDSFIGDLETYEAEAFGMGGGLGSGANGAFQFQNGLAFSLWGAGDRDWNGGDFRDAIDTEENTTTESITTIKSGFSLATPSNSIYHIRRVVQRIIQAPAPTR